MGEWLLAALLAALHQRAGSPPPSVDAVHCESRASDVRCRESLTVASDAAEQSGSRPLASATLSDDDLRALGPDSRAWFDLAARAAGTAVGRPRIFVDGLPADAGIPPAWIARIDVNADPFSVENTGVDQVRVDVDLRNPPRRWSFDTSGPSFTVGGGSTLLRARSPHSRLFSGGVSGPVPRLPLTFSIHASQSALSRDPVFASSVSGAPMTNPRFSTQDSASTLAIAATYAAPRLRVRTELDAASVRSAHAGVGGLVEADAGSALATSDARLQTSWRATGGTWIERGAVSWRQADFTTAADSTGMTLLVTGQELAGGNPVSRDARHDAGWAFRNVFESAGGGRAWLIGAESSGDHVNETQQLNAAGRLQLAALDAPTGTWFITTGASNAAVAQNCAAVFAQRVLIDGHHFTMRGGARLDWENGDGLIASPRISARLTGPAGVQFTSAAGIFADTIGADVRLQVAERDAAGAQSFVIADVDPDAVRAGQVSPSSGLPLTARFDDDYTRRRDVVWRAGAARQIRRLDLGVDYTSTHGLDLAGSRRERLDAALVDVVASDRRLVLGQTHARAAIRWTRGSLTFHYEYARSFDDTDGAFSFPERSADVSREWAASTSVPRHSVDAIASLALPSGSHLLVAFNAASGLPYTILSGADAEGLATYTDRGGLPRNSGVLPASRNLSLYAMRTVSSKRWSWAAFDLGVRADNVTDHRNVMSVGRVIGSPLFGVPLAAAPGRSIRVWASMSR